MKNPFTITRAYDFTDKEIIDYWVDLDNNGFRNILTPDTAMSLLILGGKGSGKTHIMRYHSYYLQKMRCEGDLLKQLSDDGYIGIYFNSSGLSTSRFIKKDNIEDNSAEKLQELFIYYMEIWFAQGVVRVLCDIMKKHPDVFEEEKICDLICDLFDKKPEGIKTFEKFLKFLKHAQKNIDIAINNYPFTGKLDNVEVVVSRGSFIFGINNIITEEVEWL